MFGILKAASSPKKFIVGCAYAFFWMATRFRFRGSVDFGLEDTRPEEGNPLDDFDRAMKEGK